MRFCKDRTTTVHESGTIQLSNHITMLNVLSIPSFNVNLLYVSQFTLEAKCSFTFLTDFFSIQDQCGKLISMGRRLSGLYIILVVDNKDHNSYFTIKTITTHQISQLQHLRLRHPCPSQFPLFHSIDNNIPSENENFCTHCSLSKKKHFHFPLFLTSKPKPFDLLHLDLWGKYHIPAY